MEYVINYLKDFGLVKANFMEVLKDCFNFSGTLNRTKFWTYSIVTGMATVIISLVANFIGSVAQSVIIAGIIPLVVGIGNLAISLGPISRRMRDAGFNPLHLIWGYICCMGIAPVIMCCFGTKDEAAVTATTPAPAPEQAPQNPETPQS